MSCLYKSPLNGNDSLFYQKLQKIFTYEAEDQSIEVPGIADSIYNIIYDTDGSVAPRFESFFGDFIASYENEYDDNPLMAEVTDINGEPLIFNANGENVDLENIVPNQEYFIYAPGKGKRFYITGPFADLRSDQIQDVIENLSYYIYRQVAEEGFVEKEDFDKFIGDGGIEDMIDDFLYDNDDSVFNTAGDNNEIYDLLERIEYSKDHFISGVKDFFARRGIKIQDTDVYEDEEDEIYGRTSFETNSKDKATFNIKLLLSFVPDESQTSTLGYRFVPFDKVWGFLEPKLAGFTYTQRADGSDYTIEQKQLEVIEDYIEDVSWVKTLYSYLQSASEKTIGQFRMAFDKEFANYSSGLLDKDTKNFKILRSQQVSLPKKLMNKWFNNFIDSGYVSNHDVVNHDKLLAKYEDLKKEPSLIKFKNLFSEIGIDLNERTLNKLISKDEAHLIKGLQRVIIDLNKYAIYNDGNYVNLFNRQDTFLEPIAQMQVDFEGELTENTILVGNKQYWEFGNYSYLTDFFERFKQGDFRQINELALLHPNSQWLKFIQANKDDKDVLKEIETQVFNSFRLDEPGDDAVTNKNITRNDLLAYQITDMLKVRTSTKNTTTFPTLTMGDKATIRKIQGMPYFNSSYDFKSGTFNMKISDIMFGYFMDEYERIRVAHDELFGSNPIDENKRVIYYHTDKEGYTVGVRYTEGEELKVKKFKSLDEANTFQIKTNGERFFLGNALKFNIFPVTNKVTKIFRESDGKPYGNLSEEDISKVKSFIMGFLRNSVRDSVEAIREKGIHEHNLDQAILKEYGGDVNNMVGDYVVNGMIANIESTKTFYGDISYFKDLVEVNKRAQAAGIDGLRLSVGREEGDREFSIAVIDNIIYESQYLESLEKAFGKESEEVNAYKKVNRTDAQGWITHKRWKKIVKGLNRWNDNLEDIYQKLDEGKKISYSEFKTMNMSTQPLKGVYFGIVRGVPTYLKYSQAVLIPKVVEGTGMQRLLDKMISDEVDEVVTLDGVKVGALQTTKIDNDKGDDIAADFKLNKYTLDNRNYRLQQDLPTKELKNYDVGSQLMKNILSNFDPKALESLGGQEFFDGLMADISSLSDEDANQIRLELGLDTVPNRKVLDRIIIRELKDRNAGNNIIRALEKGIPYEAIPQHLSKIENLLFSYVRKRTTKLTTLGGGFIQMASFGIDKMTSNEKNDIIYLTDDDAEVKRLKTKGLAPPREGMPGEAFISGSFISKHIPNWREKEISEILQIIDEKIFDIIGYRIPNQGISSNDNLRVVGILPDYMGDVIIPYAEITTKTGSDFDIDKMFVMVPEFNVKKGKLTYATEGTKGTKNRIIKAYWDILNHPSNFKEKMQPLDAKFLKDSIEKLWDLKKNKPVKNLFFFDPVKQLEIKYNYLGGKAGVGQTANHVVDHPLTQISKLVISSEHYTFNLFGTKAGEFTISQLLSSFLNAYVDIAKDDYIVKGNHNTRTANVAFLLLRGGVPLDNVNAFLMQDALFDLKEEQELQESKIFQKYFGRSRKATPLKQVLFNTSYGKKEIVSIDDERIPKIEDITPFTKFDLNNLDKFRDQLKNPSANFQLRVLATFEALKEPANILRDSVIASKQDVNGAGNDLATLWTAQNLVGMVANLDNVDGFIEKFTDTYIGTIYKNSVDLLDEITKEFFEFPKMRKFVDQVITAMGKYPTKDNKLTRDVIGYTRAMWYNMTPALHETDVQRLFTTFPNKIARLKYELEENELIKNMELRKGDYSFLYVNQTRKGSDTFIDSMYEGWKDLMAYDFEIATDLVKHAFYSTAFLPKINSLVPYIPHEWMLESGFDKQLLDIEPKFYDESISIILRAIQNRKLIPKLPKSSEAEVKDNGFEIKNSDPELLIENKQGQRQPLPIVSVKKHGIFALKSFQDRVKTYRARYVPVTNVGFSRKGNNIYEFTWDSIFNELIENDKEPITPVENQSELFPFLEDSLNDTIRGKSLDDWIQKSPDNTDQDLRDTPSRAKARLLKLYNADKGRFIPLSKDGGVLQNLRKSVKEVNKNFPYQKLEIVLTENGASAMLKIVDIQMHDVDNFVRDISYFKGDQALMDQENQDSRVGSIPVSKEQLNKQIKYFSSRMNTVVLEDDTLPVISRLLSKNHPLTKKYGKPVILINPNKLFSDAITHEFGHVFIDSLGGSNNGRIKAAMRYLEGTELWKEVERTYPGLNDEMLAREVVTTAIGLEASEIFEDEVKKNWFQRFLDWFFDRVSSLLGMKRDIIKSLSREMIKYKVNNANISDISQDLREKKEKVRDKIEEDRISDKESLVKRAEEIIVNKLKSIRSVRLSGFDINDNEEDELQSLAEDINKLRTTDQELAMLKFADYILGNFKSIKDSINNKKEDDEVTASFLDRIDSYFKSFELIYDKAVKFLDDKDTISKLTEAFSELGTLKIQRDTLVKNFVVERLSKESDRVEKEFRDDFEREANGLIAQGKLDKDKKQEYINDKILENEELIAHKEVSRWRNKIEEADFSIGQLEMWLRDPKSINSETISIINVLIDRQKQYVREYTNNVRRTHTRKYEEFTKGINVTSADKLYKNMIQQDEEGNYYLMDDIKPEFFRKYSELERAERKAAMDFGINTKEHTEAEDALISWREKNIVNKKPIKKWRNENWKSKLSARELAFLSHLKNINNNADNGLPRYAQLRHERFGNKFYMLPGITKSDYEAIRGAHWKELFKLSKLFKKQPDEENIYGAYNMVRTSHDDTINKENPIFYRQNVKPQDQSLDLASIYLLNTLSSTNYKANREIEPTLNLVLEAVSNKKYVKSSGGKFNLGKYNNRLELEKNENELRALQSSIDNRLYSIKEIDAGYLNKISSVIAGYAGNLLLAANYPTGIINVLQGKLSQIIEHMGNKWMTKKSFLEAEKYWMNDLKNILTETGSINQESKTMLLADKFKGLVDWSALRHNFLRNTRLKALLSRDLANGFINMGEYYMQSTVMYSILSSIKVMNQQKQFIDKNGNVVTEDKAMNLVDAYTVVDGQLKLNEHVHYNNFESTHSLRDIKGATSITNLVTKLKIRMFGQYDTELKSLFGRHWWGKLGEMFRKFIVPGFDRRVRGLENILKDVKDLEENERYYDYDTKQFEEGNYTTFARFARQFMGALRETKGNLAETMTVWHELTDYEKGNIYKTISEFVIIFTLSILSQLLKKAAEDEPDETYQGRLYWLAFLSKRLHSEMAFFNDPTETWKILHNPAVAMSVIESITKFGLQVFEDVIINGGEFETYDRGSHKGEYKAANYGKNLIPVIRYLDYDVREKMKWYYRE